MSALASPYPGIAMKHWYLFSTDDKRLYGSGTLDEALNYAERLRRTRNISCTTTALSDREAQALGLEDHPEAFSLSEALAKQKDI
jgi:hypothetical protein